VSEPLLVGTVAAPALLATPLPERRELVARIVGQGIDHVFSADHVSFINGQGMDGLINAATLCAMDERLKVLVGVYLLALRHPVPVARQLATLAESAPGQVLLGVGVGGEDRNEIAMCGVDPATRGRRTDECLTVLEGLRDGNPFSFDGEFFHFRDARIRPPPDPAIPLLIGGRSAAALRRAARFGDGWLAVWVSPERFARACAEVTSHAAALGRAAPTLHGLQLWVGIDADRERARARLAKGMERFYNVPFARFEKYSPYGSAAEVAEFLTPYRDAGCRVFNVMPLAETERAGIDAVAEIRARLCR
jgi:alkanesulfonate monooxygenase SsuD/methylene tetrahydromethanopterin reductase-like flavin-dependent oxidoreductase (luciferase family)